VKHWRSSLLAALAFASGMDAAAAHFETSSHVEVRDEFLEHGIFLPLADWEAKGYDISAIEARSHASDVMEHPLLGKTFRVRLVSIKPSLKRGRLELAQIGIVR
jgi:hypothetical protein